MAQKGQVLKLKTRGPGGKPTWAYRDRVDGRRSARPQVGAFASQGEATQALQATLERLHRRNGARADHVVGRLERRLRSHRRGACAIQRGTASAIAAGCDRWAP
jgi:hypothetical protein